MSGKRSTGQPPQPHLEEQEEEILRVVFAAKDAVQENFSLAAVSASEPPHKRIKEMLTTPLDCEQESLTPEQQEELVDWFAEHPIFYDQSTSDFKNRSKRDRLLDSKAKELGVSEDAMGRRKKASKPPPKRKVIEPLDSQFNCPFCNHEKSCEVKMDRQRNTGMITCQVCLEDFQTTINYLSEAIDVYGDWIDACEAANQ